MGKHITCKWVCLRFFIGAVIFFLFGNVSHAETYKFGITPWQKGKSIDDIRRLYKPLLKWLGKKTGHTYLIIGSKDYNQMIDFIVDGSVHFVHISPVPYVTAKKRNENINILVTELSWNKDKTEKKDSYRGYLLTLKSRSDLSNIQDIRDTRFGFVKTQSSSGFKYPNAHLISLGIDYKTYFKKYYFLGSHPRVTDAIARGSIDVGATWDFNWKQSIKKHGDIFKSIWESPPIPNLCIAAHPSLPLKLQQQIRQLLLTVDSQLLEGISAAGYVVRPDSYYDIVRQLAFGSQAVM